MTLQSSKSKNGKSGKLMVIAGPTAVGKGTLVRYILEHFSGIQVSVSATTRPPRPDEIDGKSYYFLEAEEFTRLQEQGELLEYATVHGKYSYGTPKKPVLETLKQGIHVILEIDIQGAFQVRQQYPDVIMVFIHPPSWDELVRRLFHRGTETELERNLRLETAKKELAEAWKFEHQITNTEIDQAAREIIELFN